VKYKAGDLVLIKDIHILLRMCRARPDLPRLQPLRLKNTLGIITKVEKHSKERDNTYIWYSQVDQKEYYFYQDEVDGEVIK
jgi:hypothetical protein